uniref:Secreted protein n=1 Tax=Ixodes ricinus TaxID=34613 RepID=A0A6B0U1P4_IXORI
MWACVTVWLFLGVILMVRILVTGTPTSATVASSATTSPLCFSPPSLKSYTDMSMSPPAAPFASSLLSSG